jgi:hypothetical protein
MKYSGSTERRVSAVWGPRRSQRNFSCWKALGAAVLSPSILSGCGWFYERWEWNQKLTVEVLVDGKTVSGSAVSHIMWREANALGSYPNSYSGEATIVDLGERGMLFALIGEGTKQIAAYALHEELGVRRADYETLFPKIMRFRGVREVPRDHHPLLVTFTDISDPKTVQKVEPGNLAATFGPGVALGKITLEITEEDMTNGEVRKMIDWWCDLRRKRARLNGNTGAISDNELSNNLGSGAFSTSDCN